MNRKNPLLVLLLFLLASIVCAQDTSAACAVAGGEPIRIGSIFPSDIILRASASASYQGVVAMVNALNKCGGVAGRPIELVHISARSRAEASRAVSELVGSVPLIIGSGSPAVSEVLWAESQKGAFVYWDVSEPLDGPNEWAFSPLLNDSQLGARSAEFIDNEITPLLDGKPLRLAIIHEKRPSAQRITDAFSDHLSTPPILVFNYENRFRDSYAAAKQIREKGVNAIFVVAFDRDAEQFWLSMRQADANVRAYVQLEVETSNCESVGNTDGQIVVRRAGIVNQNYRQIQIGTIYDDYTADYDEQFNTLPDQTADLSASGAYLLLHDILPNAIDDLTVGNLRQKIIESTLPVGRGLMGEGFAYDKEVGINTAGTAIFHQRQANALCSILPLEIATCTQGLQPFPTWRERVTKPEYSSCID